MGTNSSGKSTVLQAILLLAENIETPCGVNGSLVSLGEFEEARCWNSKEKKIQIKMQIDNESVSWSIYMEDDVLKMDITPGDPYLMPFKEKLNYLLKKIYKLGKIQACKSFFHLMKTLNPIN